MLEIVDMDIRTSFKNFEDVMDEVTSDFTSNKQIDFSWKSKEAHLSKSNMNVYKITINNNDTGSCIDCVAEHNLNDIVFKPFKLKNFNESFYTIPYGQNELCEVFLECIMKLTIKYKGTLGCITENGPILIEQGKNLSNRVKGYGIIDDRGKIHCLRTDSSLSDIDEDQDTSDIDSYIPRYLVNDWLDENPAFKEKVKIVTDKRERFELMAQFALYQKRKNMITSDQFRDILMQTGTLINMVGGFKDETINNIYQLLI